MTVRPDNFTITGSGGGGKGGGGGGKEQENTLKSRQLAKIVDLLSEGPIRGVVDGMKGITLDGTALQTAEGTMNYQDVDVQFVNGLPDQPIMKGFDAQQTEIGVSTRLMHAVPIVRTVANTDVDRVRVTVSVPALQEIWERGDIMGSKVSFRIEVQRAGGGYRLVGDFTISGKTSSKYQRAYMFTLPAGAGACDIRLTRTSEDSEEVKKQNDLYWDSYTEIIDDRVNYTLSAAVGIQIDAEQFPSIPTRTYLTDGLLILIPSNYDPDTRVYTGVWDGTFVLDWSNNPAWVLYDLIVQSRYGIGDFISADMVDKWAFYKVAQWCDGLVPDGKGGTEPRFTCNIQIMDQQEAFDLLAYIASIFRGFTYWNGNQLVAVADQPADPVMQFTNANVVEGRFTYSGADRRARHTMATAEWRDPAFLGDKRLAVVENQPMISRLGIQRLDIEAVGATVEGQAIRTGKWALYTEEFESEAVQFETGLESAWARPGDIVQVMDVTIAGKRRGGRVGVGSTASQVVLDAPVTELADGTLKYISCVIGEGVVETRQLSGLTDGGMKAQTVAPFSAAPVTDSVFVVSAVGELEPTLWRVLGVRQRDAGQYEVNGTRHLPGKWDYVERNLALTIPDVSDVTVRPAAITGLQLVEYLFQISPISVGVRVTVSWISPAAYFDVYYRPEDQNWLHVRTDLQAVDLIVTEGIWEFQITPMSSLGIKGPTTVVFRDIIGRFAPPAPPQLFRINFVEGVALFDWLPAEELDVIIGGHFELRHSARTSGTQWDTAQTVVSTIPGSATSVEAGYQTGTWYLRTFDVMGQPSATAAVVIALQPDFRYQQYVRICEQPAWGGVKTGTKVKTPQNWLTIDSAATPAGEDNEGTYKFLNRLDAGGVFSIRLSAEILAFQYEEPDDFIDSRITYCDTWPDWDSLDTSLEGQIVLMIRTTDNDPASGGAVWTPWKLFIAGEYYARGFEFQALLFAPAGQNIGVEELCVVADLRNKMDEGGDVPYPAATTRITFGVKFYLVPAVVVMVQNAADTDQVRIVAKTREYFDLTITNAAGTHQTRTFDWHAQGY